VDGYLGSYATLGLVIGAGVLVFVGAFGANRLLRPSDPAQPAGKYISYESGIDPVGGDWAQAQIRYYVYAYLYVLFAVEATPDDGYRGDMRIPGMYDPGGGKQTIGVTVHGREALWAMPPADQAALLPAMFTCSNTQSRMIDDFVVGFGGAPTARAAETSAVYTTQ